MIKVGLTGGYASGKSFVAEELARLGCSLIYADKLGHAALEPNGEAYAPTVAAFGKEILASDKTIDRKKLGAIVFASPELLAKLTSFVHPAVFHLEEKLFQAYALENPHGMAVVEAAILIETGRYKVFDRLLVTACSEDVQMARGMARDGLTREQVWARLSKQLPLAEKKQYADFVIDTSGSKEDTLRQVRSVFTQLEVEAKSR